MEFINNSRHALWSQAATRFTHILSGLQCHKLT